MSEYPDAQTLRFIRRYDILKDPIEDLYAFIVQSWWMPEWGTKIAGRRLDLHTGGWSGNESIMAALEKNTMFWITCWVQSRRGGHYTFEIPTKMTRRYLRAYLKKKAGKP